MESIVTWSDREIYNISTERVGSGLSTTFEMPRRAVLSFSYQDLFSSVGRTQMLATAGSDLVSAQRIHLVRDISVAIMAHIDIFVVNDIPRFAVSSDIDVLADEAKSSLASKLGAAMSDRVMEDAGFSFRANAKDVKLRAAALTQTKKMPDFVYCKETGLVDQSAMQVVVEAKGSLSVSRAGRSGLGRWALAAYRDQVEAFVFGGTADGLNLGGGCAVAFGAIPGSGESSVAIRASAVEKNLSSRDLAYVQEARTLSAAAVPMPLPVPVHKPTEKRDAHRPLDLPADDSDGGRRDGGPGRRRYIRRGAPARIVFANYEAIFLLCGADSAADILRYRLSGLRSDGRKQIQAFFLSVDDPDILYLKPFAPCWSEGSFGVVRSAAERVLQAAKEQVIPITLEMPDIPSTSRSGQQIYSDGLAWIARRPDRAEIIEWDLERGEWL